MIIIKSGEHTVYHPGNPQLRLISPKLCMEDNAAGSLTFSIYRENPGYSAIKKLFPVVTVIRDGQTIFKGRVITERKDFYNGRSVEVEGKLAFFNDSYLEPFTFQGSPESLFRMIVENHNAQVMPWQQIKVGMVTVKDSNDFIVRSSEKMLNTWNALKEKCFQSGLGGKIRIRYEEDGDYIDWLEDYSRISSQSIAFAKNLISLSQETDASETYTAIRPVGAEVEGARIDITTVNEGVPYLVNREKAAEYGIIFAPESESVWEDVTLPENLKKKAYDKLHGAMGALSETYEIKAVDLNLTDRQIEALDICEYVPVESRPHGVSGNYLLNKATISISSPQDSVYCLGASRRVMSDMDLGGGPADIPQKISTFVNDAKYVSEEKAGEILAEYSKTEEVERLVSSAVETIPAGPEGESAYGLAVRNGYEGTEAEWIDSLHGSKGDPGAGGLAASVRIGSVRTAPAGTEASVTNAGTEREAVLDFVIPRGEKGEPGSGGVYETKETLDEIRSTEAPGSLADAMAVKELAEQVPFRLGVDAAGNYGYYKDGADTVTPFKQGGGMETPVFRVPYDIAERYFTYATLDGNTYLPETDGDWMSICRAGLPGGIIVSDDFSAASVTLQIG